MDPSSGGGGGINVGASTPPASPHVPQEPKIPLRELLDPLRQLEIQSVELDVRLTRALDLDEPLNVIIRGLLGARLRDVRCLTRAPTCDGCDVAERCDYIRVFETPAALTPGARGSHGAHPFWLSGLPAEHHLPVGVTLKARVSTIGFALPLLPYLDVAFRDAWMRLAERSIQLSGSRTTTERINAPTASSSRATTWTLYAMTPLILGGAFTLAKQDCPAAPWLTLLVRSGARRLLSLGAGYAGAPERRVIAFPDLRDVELVDGRLSPWRSSRYSLRQGRRHPLEGWAGSMTVRGDVMPEVAPLLEALRVFGVGKGTTMGFGQLSAEEVTRDDI